MEAGVRSAPAFAVSRYAARMMPYRRKLSSEDAETGTVTVVSTFEIARAGDIYRASDV